MRYPLAALCAVGAGLLCFPLSVWLEPGNLVMVFLAAVAAAAYLGGRGPSLLASLLGVLLYDYFFVPPYHTFAVHDKQYLITFTSLVVGGLVVSTLTARARDQARAATAREQQTAALYALSRDLGLSQGAEEIRRVVELHAGRQVGLGSWFVLPADGGLDFSHRTLPAALQGLAQTAYQHGREVSAPGLLAIPVRVEQRVVGVLGLEGVPEAASRQLLEATLSQAALALERARLARAEREADLLRANEALQSALLNSVSHDLRIPLVSITGALSALSEEGVYQDLETRRALLDNARSEADRLNRLVSNLLQLTRLESGMVELNRVPCDVVDLISTTLPVLGLTEVRLDLADNLPLISGDYVLLQHVLQNLLDNANKYAVDLEVGARPAGDKVELWVSDRGPGVPAGEPIFERFYRGKSSRGPGSGLGLSICKGLVEAHGGTIRVEPRPGGGSTFRVLLPIRGPGS